MVASTKVVGNNPYSPQRAVIGIFFLNFLFFPCFPVRVLFTPVLFARRIFPVVTPPFQAMIVAGWGKVDSWLRVKIVVMLRVVT